LSFTDLRPLRLAMHVHGSWSEGDGSWEAQFTQAARNDIDVMYMSDHDKRCLATGYLRSLRGAQWDVATGGRLLRHRADAIDGSVHLLAESASGSPASVRMTLDASDTGQARRRLRTSIAGQTLVHKT